MNKIRTYVYFIIGCLFPICAIVALCFTKQPAYVATAAGIMLFGFISLGVALFDVKSEKAEKEKVDNK